MSVPRIELDGPHYPRRAVRRAACRWAMVIVATLAAVTCLVALPAIAAVIHFGV